MTRGSVAPTERSGSARLPVADGPTVVARLGTLMRGRRRDLVVVAIVLAVGAALGLVAPWGFGRIVDLPAREGGDVGDVLALGTVMCVAAIGGAALTGLGVALSAKFFETLLARIREAMVTASLRLPQSRVEEAGAGDLVSRATDDVSVVSAAIARAVPALSRSVFAVVLTAVGMLALDWRFGVVILVVLPVHIAAVRMYMRTAPPVYTAERAAMADRAHHVLGAIRGLPSVRAFGLADVLGQRIALGSWGVVRWTMRARIVQNRFFGRINLAEFLGMATIVVVGFLLVGADLTTVGATTTAMLLFLRLFDPIGALLMVIDDVQSAIASLGRIVGVIDLADGAETDTDAPSTVDIPTVDAQIAGLGELTVSGLSFGYDRGGRVLHDISLRVAAGEHVAVVGSSGAGKTTLASLVAGILSPAAGDVRLDGRPIPDTPDGGSGERPALITQDVHVFAGRIADDLRMAAPDADDARLREALRAVGASEWVNTLSDGVDTVVGAGGMVLTPMRSQQLALARLILLDPSMVVLDEATADADSADADVLEAAADAALAGRSALIVAHRLSQAARADRVLVLERGAIVEQGTHAELVAAGGRYARLWQAWTRHRGGDEPGVTAVPGTPRSS
ncbi:ABC transporter ATP-binding protein [Gordonia soli]|uniref:Putative ABC transporter permease/ATP-binding protein n=1 Tax=Gordonia soli NBRC 108243 TaxID=1223545 RepID=M0QR69_9ACTN|nr:ABC transporter ATP-binding protein [Gordonia soli]GAC70884.1 putative ABC transporter permease/ATP-binding protein [Gordonia soli NBRC 108243]